MTPRRMHIWIPEWSGPGGIQAFSRHLVSACVGLLPETEIEVLVRNGPCPPANLGPNVTGATTGRVPAPLRRAAYSALLARASVARPPDLVLMTHLHFAPLAWLLQGMRRFPFRVVAHGMEAWHGLTPLRRRALKAADRLLPVSQHTEQRLRAVLEAPAPVMQRLPNTVDETIFTPGPKPRHLLRRYDLLPSDPVLLTVARLDPRQRDKGIDQVLEALVRVRRSLPRVRYIIAGRGNDSRRLRQRARELGVAGSVILTGFVPACDLPDHFRLCDLFVMPSRAEGFGIVFLEALACGRRVIAGGADGSSEPLLQGRLGTLIEPRHPVVLAHAIIRLLRAPHGLAEAGELRSHVVAHFGSAAFRQHVQQVLQL